jgi:hypothetical protein
MVDRFDRGAGGCAGPRSTSLHAMSAKENLQPPPCVRSRSQPLLLRRTAVSFNKPDAVNERPALPVETV